VRDEKLERMWNKALIA